MLVVLFIALSAVALSDARPFNATAAPFNATANCNFGPLYKQCDSEWGSHKLGTSSNTICQAGCAMSSVAMFITGRGHHYTPGTLNAWLTSHGGYADGDLLIWGSVDSIGGVTYIGQETPSEAVLASGLNQCHGLIANVHGGKHWVLLTAYNGNGVFEVHDPGFSTTTYHYSDILRVSVYH